MSEEHARQFIHAVEQDPTLQQTIRSFTPATAAADIAKLGAERDLHFSAAEFSETLDSILQNAKGEITDDALDSVAGGGGQSSGAGTYYDANPNFHVKTGTPHSVYWIQHGAISPGTILDFKKH